MSEFHETFTTPEQPVDQVADTAQGLYSDTPYVENGVSYPVLARERYLTGAGYNFENVDVSSAGFGPRVVAFRPEQPSGFSNTLLLVNGFGMPPTSMMGDKLFDAARDVMSDRNMFGLAYSPRKRGTDRPDTKIWLAGEGSVERNLTKEIRQIASYVRMQMLFDPNRGVVLVGHSQGGQHVMRIASNPKKYGFLDGQIRGAVLINPVIMPHTAAMWKHQDFRALLPELVAPALPSLNGRGILLRDKPAFDALISDGKIDGRYEKRLIESSYPGEGVWFLQTLTTGTAPRIDKPLNIPVSLVASDNDKLFSLEGQSETHHTLERNGARVDDMHVIPGGHFSPFIKTVGEPPRRPEAITDTLRAALLHACSEL